MKNSRGHQDFNTVTKHSNDNTSSPKIKGDAGISNSDDTSARVTSRFQETKKLTDQRQHNCDE